MKTDKKKYRCRSRCERKKHFSELKSELKIRMRARRYDFICFYSQLFFFFFFPMAATIRWNDDGFGDTFTTFRVWKMR